MVRVGPGVLVALPLMGLLTPDTDAVQCSNTKTTFLLSNEAAGAALVSYQCPSELPVPAMQAMLHMRASMHVKIRVLVQA